MLVWVFALSIHLKKETPVIVELYTKTNELVDGLEFDSPYVPRVGETLFFDEDHEYFDARERISVTAVSYRLDSASAAIVPIVIAHGSRP